MDLKIDYRNVNWVYLRSKGITQKDLSQFFQAEWLEIENLRDKGFSYAIAYVNEQKMIHIAYRISKNVNFDIEVLQIGIPNGEDIKRYWCK